jgi:putative acetyltransferase
VIVREERPSDYSEISEVVEAAFRDVAVARLVDDIRASSGHRPQFSLVADEDGAVIGHVMLSEVRVGDARALQLSPLAVRPDRQRSGVGSALVREALRRADAHAEPLVLVEGDPAYYSRFGFVRSTELGIERPHEGVPEWAFQGIALADGHPRGRAVYPPPFDPFV